MIIDIAFTLLLLISIYQLGIMMGERRLLKKIKDYILESNNWDEFLEKLSEDFNDWEV